VRTRPDETDTKWRPAIPLLSRWRESGTVFKGMPVSCLVDDSRTCKPNFVWRLAPSGRSFLWAARYRAALATYPGLSSIAGCPSGLARRAGTPPRCRDIVPYLVLLRVGFTMPRALLSGRCALTAPFHPYRACARRYVFCGTGRPSDLNPTSRTLSGTLLCGVRTFLPRLRASDRPVRLSIFIL